jgi:hypothetical protein
MNTLTESSCKAPSRLTIAAIWFTLAGRAGRGRSKHWAASAIRRA